MIVADTSALCSLAAGSSLELVVAEFDIRTTETIVEELEATAAHDDQQATAASRCLDLLDGIEVHTADGTAVESSRIDPGEGSCAQLARDLDADYLLTDDLRALPELEQLVPGEVAISPFLLAALVRRGSLDAETAERRLDRIAETRSWLGAPIYRRAKGLLRGTTG